MSELTNPRQTVLVSCRGSYNDVFSHRRLFKDNIITVDWHMPTSFKPFLYAVSIGKTRFSMPLIKDSRVFVVNFMGIEHEKEVLFCGRNSGLKTDKFSKLTKEESEKIDCPRVKESLGYLECEVIDEFETGDHVVFIGKVVASDLKSNHKRIFHISGDDFTTTI